MAPHCHVRLWYNFRSGYLLPRSRFYVLCQRLWGEDVMTPLILWPTHENVETASRTYSYHLLMEMETDCGGNRGRLYTHHYRQAGGSHHKSVAGLQLHCKWLTLGFIKSISLVRKVRVRIIWTSSRIQEQSMSGLRTKMASLSSGGLASTSQPLILVKLARVGQSLEELKLIPHRFYKKTILRFFTSHNL